MADDSPICGLDAKACEIEIAKVKARSLLCQEEPQFRETWVQDNCQEPWTPEVPLPPMRPILYLVDGDGFLVSLSVWNVLLH